MATTYDYINRSSATVADWYGDATYKPDYLKNRLYVVQRTVNLATAATDLGASLVQNDVMELIDVPAKTWVLAGFCRIVTANTTMTDLDIGDGTQVDGFIDGATMAVIDVITSNLITNAYSVATAGGKVYTSADTIDAKCIDASFTSTGSFELTFIMLDIS